MRAQEADASGNTREAREKHLMNWASLQVVVEPVSLLRQSSSRQFYSMREILELTWVLVNNSRSSGPSVHDAELTHRTEKLAPSGDRGEGTALSAPFLLTILIC
jgi:hypothetical protein